MSNDLMVTAEVQRLYGVKNDECVLDFFASKEIQPVISKKYGRGTIRFWDTKKVTALHAEFDRFNEKRKQAAHAALSANGKKAHAAINTNGHRLENIEAILVNLSEQINRIESRLNEDRGGNGLDTVTKRWF